MSLPTTEVYNVTVPTVDNLTSEFFYNFFSTDEYANDAGTINSDELQLNSSETPDAAFFQYAVSKMPRMIVLSWSPVHYFDVPDAIQFQNGSLIKQNYSSIVSEDTLSKSKFLSISYFDGETQDKRFKFVSGSYSSRTFSNVVPTNTSPEKIANAANVITPTTVSQDFLLSSMTNLAKSAGAYFVAQVPGEEQPIVNATFNGKFLKSTLERQMLDPTSPYSVDLVNVYKFTTQLNFSQFSDVTDDDYKTYVPYFNINIIDESMTHSTQPEVVGYVIDKTEITSDGNVVQHPQMILENAKANKYVDFKIKYGSTYSYSIRAIAAYTLSAIDVITNDVALLRTLVAGKLSNKVYAQAIDTQAPPPPADVDFRWDYDNDRLIVNWSFPVNSQRDIKKFQVFRRASLNNSYELIKMYDFNDAQTVVSDLENNVDNTLVQKLTSPYNIYFDEDFDKVKHHSESSALLYALASVDAHGYTSNYSMQFAVWFDSFKNKVQKKLISHSGAPKPYPNMYLLADALVDTIRVRGSKTTRMKLYFNPQYYYVIDANGAKNHVITTLQENGSYKINVINLDNQKSDVVSVTVDDKQKVIIAGPKPIAQA
jgi:hypothetical protein